MYTLRMKSKRMKNLLNILLIMYNLELKTLTEPICSILRKIWATLTLNKKRALIVVVSVAVAAVALLLTSCGTTRTVVRTQGKGTTNAQISVTTNNPTSVSVETRLDSTKLQINKSPQASL